LQRNFHTFRHASSKRFGAGMDNIAFLVDRKYVFRFPRRSIIVPLLETETAVLPLIAPHVPIPVPVPRFKGVPQGAYPWMFAGYELLPGTTACSVALTDARLALAPALGSITARSSPITASK
jgi:aminoglycoside phosphotransferase (APT) family kinase protein